MGRVIHVRVWGLEAEDREAFHGRFRRLAAREALVRAGRLRRRLRGGGIGRYPPRALGFAFGTVEGGDPERRVWSFLVHGMRASADSFLEAEAEAMRIYRGLRFLR